jgi:hypothetical protein
MPGPQRGVLLVPSENILAHANPTRHYGCIRAAKVDELHVE